MIDHTADALHYTLAYGQQVGKSRMIQAAHTRVMMTGRRRKSMPFKKQHELVNYAKQLVSLPHGAIDLRNLLRDSVGRVRGAVSFNTVFSLLRDFGEADRRYMQWWIDREPSLEAYRNWMRHYKRALT